MTLDTEELSERLEWAAVPKRFRDCRFTNFEAYNVKLARKVATIEQLTAKRRGIFLFGPVGSGKSHLAVSVLAAYTEIGARCKFLSAAEFTNSVQLAFGNPNEIVKELLDSHCLLIDDLGSERATEASRAAMFYLIDQAYGARKKIIVTTNMIPKDVYNFEPRIMSRLTEACALVELAADDYRIRTAAQQQKLVRPKTGTLETVN
jgi:DNA replication protein DnaC